MKVKTGDIVTINDKKYKVTQACSSQQHVVCKICGSANKCTPCIESNNYPQGKHPFSVKKCHEKIPSGNYLKCLQ